jgi:hypothetical protein
MLGACRCNNSKQQRPQSSSISFALYRDASLSSVSPVRLAALCSTRSQGLLHNNGMNISAAAADATAVVYRQTFICSIRIRFTEAPDKQAAADVARASRHHGADPSAALGNSFFAE